MTDTDRQAYSRVRIANQLNQKQWNSYSILNIWDGVFDICDGVFDIWDVLFGIWDGVFVKDGEKFLLDLQTSRTY